MEFAILKKILYNYKYPQKKYIYKEIYIKINYRIRVTLDTFHEENNCEFF